MVLSIYTNLTKLDEDDEVGEDDAEYLQYTHLIKLDENDEVGEHGAQYLNTSDKIV
jgi:hypothetical protein